MKKWLCIALAILVAASIVIAWSAVRCQLGQTHDMLTSESISSYTDEFHVTVLEAKSAPNSFMERVRITCEKDMEVGIEVVDPKETGIHEVHGKNGEMFYHVGAPYKTGQSRPVEAHGNASTCEILYSLSATASNTTWQSRISTATTSAFSQSKAADSIDTKLPIPMTITEVQTNWPDSYRRGSWIPLANLGDYKIVVTVK